MIKKSKIKDLTSECEVKGDIYRFPLIVGVEFAEPKNDKEIPKLLLKSNEIPLITLDLSKVYDLKIISEEKLIVNIIESPTKSNSKEYIIKLESFELYKNLYNFIPYTTFTLVNNVDFYNELIKKVFDMCFIERKSQDHYYFWPEIDKIKEKYNIKQDICDLWSNYIK